MIHIENLKYKYQGAKHYVFDNFSLDFEDNNIRTAWQERHG